MLWGGGWWACVYEGADKVDLPRPRLTPPVFGAYTDLRPMVSKLRDIYIFL